MWKDLLPRERCCQLSQGGEDHRKQTSQGLQRMKGEGDQAVTELITEAMFYITFFKFASADFQPTTGYIS